jgi:hypothetical protein
LQRLGLIKTTKIGTSYYTRVHEGTSIAPARYVIVVLLMSSFAFSQIPRHTNEGYHVQLFVPVGSGWESQDVLLNFDNAIVLFSAVDSRFKIRFNYILENEPP